MKHEVTAYVHMAYDWKPDYSEKHWRPEVWKCKLTDETERIFIAEQRITVEIPDDFDPVPGQVAALEAERREAMAEYQAKVARINERLSKLQAIEYAP